MGKWAGLFRGSIRLRFIGLTVSALVLILAGAIYVLLSTLQITNEYSQETASFTEKKRLVANIATDAKQALMHARGYLVFLSEYEYDQSLYFRDRMNDHLANIRDLPLSVLERELIDSIQTYVNEAFDVRYPIAFYMAEAGNYAGIREMVRADDTRLTNSLIALSERLEREVSFASERSIEQLRADLARQGSIFIGYILLIVAVWINIIRRTTTYVNAPLIDLSRTAVRFAAGEQVTFGYRDREDEIGRLAQSLESMMRMILTKEEALVAKNEELLAQQDELQVRQRELQEALTKTEEHGNLLRRRNTLVQSLANTLDKRELLASIVQSMVEITSSDKGIIVLFNARRDYASFGMSPQAAEQFMGISDESLMVRIIESRKLYVVERAALAGEQMYHPDPITVTDLYVPILGPDGSVAACMLLTKIGKRTSQAEQEELTSLATQISLALAKLDLYEESEYQRQLNFDMLKDRKSVV